MAVKFLSDGHFSGSSTDLTLDGHLFLPSYASFPGTPTISFDSNAGGIWYESDSDALHFRASGGNRAYISSSGITSLSNVYTAASGQFRNYSGEWRGTTGITGNGFKFTNTADNVDALTLSATGNATFAGSVTGTQFKLNNNVTNTNADSFFVYSDGGSTAYGMTLWNTSGTSGEWATMIFGPNQASRRISFGKANGNFGTNHAGIDELAYLDLDNGNFHIDGAFYGDGSNLTGISIDGGNATTLDSLDSTQFLRSDTADTAAGAITFSEDITLNAAKLLKSSANPTSNFLDFDDDSTTHNPDTNVTTLASVSGIAMATNLNDGGGGNFTISTGSTGTQLLRITTAGNATFAGNVTLNSRLTFDYGGDHYFEAGTNTLAYKSSGGTSIMLLNASTSAATFAGQVEVALASNQIKLSTGTTGDGYLNIGHFSNGTFIGTYGDDGGAADLLRFGVHSGDVALTINTDKSATFAGDVSMVNGNATGKFAVKSTGVHGSYDFYNDGTSYFNGDVTIDANITQTTGTTATFAADITAGSFIKSGGTSSQFLMADGSVSTGGSGISQADADIRYVNVTGDTMTGNLNVNGTIIGEGNLFLRSYNNDPKGIFFRDGFEYGDTNQYNLSITIYDDGDGAADGMNINAYDGIYFNVQSGTTPSTAFRVLNGEVRSYKPLISDSSFQMNDSSTQVTMSGNTSGNFTLDNNTGSIAFQANGSTVNSMTITSSAITLNENTTVTGTFDPQGNILGAVIDDGNTANPLQVRRSAATTMQVGINFTVSPSSGSGFSRYLGVDPSADLRFGSSTNHGTNALVLTTANYVSQFGSFAGDIIPSADSTYDLGSNATKWAEGHFDHLYIGETGNNPRIDIYTENETASIADTFTDTTTDKSYIYFQAGTSSNDPGYIMHETSNASSPNEQNEGVLHLVPSDDNGTGDYVSIHGTNDPDAIKLHTSGLIETANYQLVLRSAVGDVYIDDGLTVNGTIAATGGTSTTWNEAHDNMIISASVSGTSTKTLTLNQNDGGTITASWTDLQGTTVSAPNAPTNLSLSIVNNTINVTFDASSTSGIDQYLVFGSANGGDYSLISVIEPASMSATMSVIDDSFDDSGAQAYRVYAMKTGVMSSVLSGSITYTVSTPVEPTNMSVVNLNTAFYIQWDPPSSNARFVTAYNVYKHEHASQSSLSKSSATLIYSGMNTSYMYEISGNNNLSYHQFWVETTVT